VLKVPGSTERFGHARVVLHAVTGRNLRIAPAVILEQLSTAIEEGLQIRVDRVDRAGIELLGAGGILLEIERPEIPARIFEDDVLVVVGGDGERLRAAPRRPAELAARLETGERASGLRIVRRRVDGADRFDLRARQTRRRVGAFAFEDLRIEPAR